MMYGNYKYYLVFIVTSYLKIVWIASILKYYATTNTITAYGNESHSESHSRSATTYQRAQAACRTDTPDEAEGHET